MNFNYWDVECECGHERRYHRVDLLSNGTFSCYCKGDGFYVPYEIHTGCKCKDFDESFASVVKFEREMEKERNGK